MANSAANPAAASRGRSSGNGGGGGGGGKGAGGGGAGGSSAGSGKPPARQGGVYNHGLDDENFDYIVHEGEVFHGRYAVRETIGKGDGSSTLGGRSLRLWAAVASGGDELTV